MFPAILMIQACAPDIGDNPLSGGQWLIATGEISDSPADALARDFTPVENLSMLEKRHPSLQGVIWIKKDFTMNGDFRTKRLSALLGVVNPVDEAYINGHFIGARGIMPVEGRGFFSDWNNYRYYPVSNEFLREGTNTLLIKVYTFYEGSLDMKVALGETATIEQVYNFENFWRRGINALIMVIVLFFGFYHLLIYVKRRQDRENLYYALMALFFTIYEFNMIATGLPFNLEYNVSYFIFQKIIFLGIYLTAFYLVRFTNEFLKYAPVRPLRIVFYAVIAIGILFTLAVPDYGMFVGYSKTVAALVILIALLYMIIVVLHQVFKKSRLARLFLLGIIPLVFCTTFDIIVHNILQINDYIYLGAYGLPSFLIVIAFVMAGNFVHYRNEAEELNVHLDKKVEERTKQLQEAKEEIEAAMEELEAMNDNLVQTNRDLEDAQRIAARDMQMAVNVQGSFFPGQPPAVQDYDVSFVFKPMAGVSGDLYDFYEKDGRLSGIGLFDVSGHGIASGLITMIGKSIIFRNFHRGHEDRLSRVMEKINRDLIQEIGNVDNYLTGVLLRFNDDSVDYVNAGHTDLLLRRTDGKVRVVQPKDADFKGFYLGIEAMAGEYKEVRFRLNTGEALLLYCDCLLEEKNAEGEEFGVERLSQALAREPEGSAMNMLQAVLRDFYSFTGKETGFDDDLTAIMIVKK